MRDAETTRRPPEPTQAKTVEKEATPKRELPGPEEFISVLEKNNLPEHARVYRAVVELANAIKEAGGQALLVGGCIRDMLAGKIPKDFDIEVYKLKPAQIEEVAKRFGKVSDVGKAFGILKVSLGQGVDIDLSLPRTDSKIGVGHKGFEVKSDPNMSVADAARRRDFTINSMAGDPLTCELFDPFGGAKDLRDRVLRVTGEERFRDDPLRVMRALQFVGRLGLSIEPESVRIITSMVPELKELPKERIYGEWKKLLLNSEKPSLGLSAGMALGVFKRIHPEFPPLAETPQEPEWHPEGDVWIHTLMAVDEAADIVRRENLDEETAFTVMLATLCHDLGKPAVTEYKEGRLRSYAHDQAGEEPTKKFLATLGVQGLMRDKIVRLVVDHLAPSMLYITEKVKKQPVSDGAIRKLATRLTPATIQELVCVAEADHVGRGPFQDPEIKEQLLLNLREYPAGLWLLKRARDLAVEKSKPVDLLQGRDLLNFGVSPGKHMGDIIKLANKLRDENELTKEAVLQAVYECSGDTKATLERLTAMLE